MSDVPSYKTWRREEEILRNILHVKQGQIKKKGNEKKEVQLVFCCRRVNSSDWFKNKIIHLCISNAYPYTRCRRTRFTAQTTAIYHPPCVLLLSIEEEYYDLIIRLYVNTTGDDGRPCLRDNIVCCFKITAAACHVHFDPGILFNSFGCM